MPHITQNANNEIKKKQEEIKRKEEIKEIAKEIAKEMAAEMVKAMPKQQIIQQQHSPSALPESEKADIIELESSFVDPTDSSGFEANLENIESTKGESIKDKIAKLKEIKGEQ